jgi:hypothetical protein
MARTIRGEEAVMPFASYGPDGGLRHEVARRPAPRCYTRSAPSEAAPSRIDTKAVVLVLAVGVISWVAMLLAVNSGWSF